MSDCREHEPALAAYIHGDGDETSLGPLLVHCRTCGDCRRLLELHRDLVDLGARSDEPDAAAFDALRARVIDGVAARRGAGNARWSARWLRLAPATYRVAAAAAVVVLVFVVGLATGRTLSGGDVSVRPVANGNGTTSRMLAAINVDAASNRQLSDVEESRFTYSNVGFRRVDADRVALDFDVSTHVHLVEPEESEIVREVLVQSLLNPSSTGTRLKAMSYAAGAVDPKVREGLVFAMRNDENLAVRMKALTILSDRLHEPQVENAVLSTLRDDESVQMRLLALDYLAAHSVDRDRIRAVIRESERPGDEALTVRLAEYEKRL